MLMMVMDNNRVLQIPDQLREECRTEVEYITNLPAFIWEAVAEFTGIPGDHFRSRVLGTIHTSVAFVEFRVFNNLEQRPFSFARPGTDAKLCNLRDGPGHAFATK